MRILRTRVRAALGLLLVVGTIAAGVYIYQQMRAAGAESYPVNIAALIAFTAVLLVILGLFILRQHERERALRKLNETLEQRVAERTQALSTAYEELKQSQAHLIQAEKMSALGRLVAGIAHEINTPLAYSRSNVVMVNEQLYELRILVDETHRLLDSLHNEPQITPILQQNNEVREQLDLVREQTVFLRDNEIAAEMGMLLDASKTGLDQIATMVHDLKDFSRLDRKRVENINLNDSLDSALSIARNSIKYKADIVKKYGDIPVVSCSPSQLNQVFLNLLVNAAQAIENRGTITLTTLAENGSVKARIEDDGKGIPEADLANIFDPFFTTKPLGEGTGLGLSIVYQIIEQHGGTIEAQSKPGTGTCFTVSFPVSGESDLVPAAVQAASV